jgi:hypothetical protein
MKSFMHQDLRLAFAFSVVCAASACVFSPDLGEGRVLCGPADHCPPGYGCGPDKRCYTFAWIAATDGGVADVAIPDLSNPSTDDLSQNNLDLTLPCVPLKCPQQNPCGKMDDGCGQTLNCGNTCPAALPFCGGGGPNVCGASMCVPAMTCPTGKQCGPYTDGCSSTITCGTCPAGQTCAGDGTQNHCCVPLTACPPNSNCGRAPDGCGGAITCGGSCNGQRSCGGGGTANQCGPNHSPCTPKSCVMQGKQCGESSDGCGDIISSCGVCPTGKTCVNNMCV